MKLIALRGQIYSLQFGKYSSHHEVFGIKVAHLKDICNLCILVSEERGSFQSQDRRFFQRSTVGNIISSGCL
jgi:hypothetical protein